MRGLLPFLITGLVTGSLYGLTGLGLVLTYRTSGVFNLGHGAIAAGAAFVFYTLHVTHRVPWPLAALVTLLFFAGVVGYLLELLTRGLRDVPQTVVVTLTVGIFLGTQGLLFLLYGNVGRAFPQFLPISGFTVAGVNVAWAQVISLLIAVASAAGLYLFLQRSRLGIAMRAVVDDPVLLGLSGERPRRVRLAAWSIGSAFAALSGILLAPTLNLDATLLSLLVVQAFGACAIGLFSSLPLTFAGGLFTGVAASLATRYLTDQPFSGIPSSVPFLVLIVVLLIVPTRKLPRSTLKARALVSEGSSLSIRTRALMVTLGGAVLLAVPYFVGTKLSIWTGALTAVVLFASLSLLVWTSGQISLCHLAFAAIGATTMAQLTTDAGAPWLLALLLAGAAAVPAGALVAIPAIRLPGIYLALLTLGFGILMQNVIYPTSFMFTGSAVVNAPRPQVGVFDGTNDRHLYYLILAVVVLACAVLSAIARGRLGRLLRAMAESPTMLVTHGLAVDITRLIVFCVSAFFAGVAGALTITQNGGASGQGYGPLQSLILLTVLAICGTGLLRTAIAAAALYAIVPGYLPGFSVDLQVLTFGLIAIAASLVLARWTDLSSWLARAARTSAERTDHGPVPARGVTTIGRRERAKGEVTVAVESLVGRP